MIELIISEEYGYKYYSCLVESEKELLDWWKTFNNPMDFYQEGPTAIPKLKEWGIKQIKNLSLDEARAVTHYLHLHDNDDTFLKIHSVKIRLES